MTITSTDTNNIKFNISIEKQTEICNNTSKVQRKLTDR